MKQRVNTTNVYTIALLTAASQRCIVGHCHRPLSLASRCHISAPIYRPAFHNDVAGNLKYMSDMHRFYKHRRLKTKCLDTNYFKQTSKCVFGFFNCQLTVNIYIEDKHDRIQNKADGNCLAHWFPNCVGVMLVFLNNIYLQVIALRHSTAAKWFAAQLHIMAVTGFVPLSQGSRTQQLSQLNICLSVSGDWHLIHSGGGSPWSRKEYVNCEWPI